MKLLKIENDCGHFLSDDGDYYMIDEITKEDVLRFVKEMLDGNGTIDEYDEEKIKNRAHQVVYRNIWTNLKSLAERKEEFEDKAERMYLEAYRKYVDDHAE